MAEVVKETDQVSWNLSMPLTLQIAELLNISSRADINGNIKKYYYTLKAIKKLVPELNKEERKQFKEMEVSMFKFPKKFKDIGKKLDEEKVEEVLNSLTYKKIEKYHELLMDSLDRYGYLLAKKQDAKKMF